MVDATMKMIKPGTVLRWTPRKIDNTFFLREIFVIVLSCTTDPDYYRLHLMEESGRTYHYKFTAKDLGREEWTIIYESEER